MLAHRERQHTPILMDYISTIFHRYTLVYKPLEKVVRALSEAAQHH
jgi:hypothetical protein